VTRTRRTLAAEDGYTLPELLTGMVIAMIVLFAAFQTLDRVISTTGTAQRRVEATQRGRQAMEDITRQLRSQVCLAAPWTRSPEAPIVVKATGPTTAAPTAAGTQSVAFYTDLQKTAPLQSSTVAPPQLRVLRFDGAAFTLSVDTYTPTVTTAADGAKTATYPGPPATRTLLTNVHRDGSTPVFRFYADDPAATPPQPTREVFPWTAGASTVAKLAVTFDAWPTEAASAQGVSSVLTDDVLVREVDSNDTTRIPNCQ
jgi:Tfp pilus assembly protein PilW